MMKRGIRYGLGMLLAVGMLIQGVLASAAEAPVTAQLSVLSAPVTGGSGQVIWAGVPGATPESAELAFILKRPGDLTEKVTTMSLLLVKGQVTERIYAFMTPQVGTYVIKSRLRMTVQGVTSTREDTISVNVTGPPTTAPPDIPLTLNGPLVTAEVSTTSQLVWFTFNQPTYTQVVIECIRGSMPQLEVSIHTNNGGNWQSSARLICDDKKPKVYITLKPWYDFVRRFICIRQIDGKSTGSFTIRITTTPLLEWFRINSGAVSTAFGTVTLDSSPTITPDEYIASESLDFAGAAWQTYRSSPTFKLLPSNGLKRIYFKVRRNGVESPIYSDEIYYQPLSPLALGSTGQQGNIAMTGVNAWYRITIPRQGLYSIETTALSNNRALSYLYTNPNDQFPLARDTAVSATNRRIIIVDLQSGTYYVKVASTYAPCPFSIRVMENGQVSIFAINNNAAETSSRVVTLNNTFTGQPAYYMASVYPDFRGAAWLPYSASPKFKLNAGNVLKKVYFKIKNAAGYESEVVSDTIMLREILPLKADGAWTTSQINPVGDADWFQFTVTTAGTYAIETRCGTLEDTVLDLYLPSAAKDLFIGHDDDSGMNYAAKIVKYLKAGTYRLKVSSHFANEAGTYSVMVKRGG